MQSGIKKRVHDKYNRTDNSKTLLEGKAIESRSATAIKPNSVFRNHFLNNSLTSKSGYLFSTYENKVKLAKYWLRALKNHKQYIPIEIQKGSSLNDVMTLLHKETDRLFRGYDWILRYETQTVKDLKIYYYDSLGPCETSNLPIEWISEHKNSAFRTLGLTLIKNIAHSFNISMFSNDIFEMVLDNGLKDGEYNEEHLKKELIEWYGFEEENDRTELEEIIEDFKAYLIGDIAKLRNEISEIQLNVFDFKNLLKLIPLELAEWLGEGRKLLFNTVDIDSFDFVPFDIDRNNGDPITIHQSIFFPYSFYNKPMEQYEEWVNDIANNTGTNDMYKYGALTKDSHILPTNEKTLLDLIKWLDKGRDLYFKEKENGSKKTTNRISYISCSRQKFQ